MRTAIEAINLRAEDYLEHGYKRGVYLMEYAENTREFLAGDNTRLELHRYSMDELIASWQRYNSKPI
jgi:hypothetical protein